MSGPALRPPTAALVACASALLAAGGVWWTRAEPPAPDLTGVVVNVPAGTIVVLRPEDGTILRLERSPSPHRRCRNLVPGRTSLRSVGQDNPVDC